MESFLLTSHRALYHLAVPGADDDPGVRRQQLRRGRGRYTTVGQQHLRLHLDPAGGFHQVNDPNGVGSTIVNGVNDPGDLVGFYTDSKGNTDGMLATP